MHQDAENLYFDKNEIELDSEIVPTQAPFEMAPILGTVLRQSGLQLIHDAQTLSQTQLPSIAAAVTHLSYRGKAVYKLGLHVSRAFYGEDYEPSDFFDPDME